MLPRAGRRPVPLALTLLLAAGALAAPARGAAAPPAAPADQSIAGRLTGPDGAPVAHVGVQLLTTDDPHPTVVDGADTGTDGRYRLHAEPGTYRIRFAPPGHVQFPDDPVPPPGLLTEYWPDSPDGHNATQVVLRGGQHLEGKDAVVSDGSVLAGRVTDLAGAPVAGASVTVHRFDVVRDRWEVVADTESDGSGDYRMPALAPGTYRLAVWREGYLQRFWPGAPTIEEAGDIVIGEDDVVRGATLLRPGSVSGNATTVVGGTPAPVAPHLEREVGGSWVQVPSEAADDGSFRVDGLHPGTYRLSFTSHFPVEYWDNRATAAEATTLTLAPEQHRAGLEVQLRGASVTGRVTTPDGTPSSTDVQLARWEDGRWASPAEVRTDTEGWYAFTRQPAGRYRLTVQHPWQSTANPPVELELEHEEQVTRPTAVVPPGATVSGRLVDGGGAPVAGAGVRLYRVDEGRWVTDAVVRHRTGPDGTYQVDGLGPGPVRVGFHADAEDAEPAEYWHDAETIAGATSLELDLSSTHPGVDAAVVADGTITGRAVGVDGAAVTSRVTVAAYREDDRAPRDTAVLDAAGDFALDDLAPGTYRLHFEGEDHLPEVHPDAFDIEAGSALAAEPIVLATGSAVAGTATDAGGRPVAGAFVRLLRRTEDGTTQVDSRLTEADGRFAFDGLPAGSYVVHVLADLSSGDHVDVAPEVVVGDDETVDEPVVLDPAGTISGRVTGPSGGSGTTVTVERSADGQWRPVTSLSTGLDDHYSTGALTPGTYRVGFAQPHRFPSFSDPVVVTADGSAPGTDAVLRGFAIRGSVDGPPAVAGVRATAYAASGEQWVPVRGADVEADGRFTIGPLEAGEYVLGYHHPTGALPDVFGADEQATARAARPITVHRDEHTRAIMRAGGVVHGRLFTEEGQPGRHHQVAAVRRFGDGWRTEMSVGPTDQGYFRLGGLPAGSYRLSYNDTLDPDDEPVIEGGCSLASGTAFEVDGDVLALGDRRLPTWPVPGTEGADAPAVSGAPVVGRTLTAVPGPWDPCDRTLAYQWLADGVPIPGATGATYTAPRAMAGARLAVSVTGRYPRRPAVEVTSAASPPVGSAPQPPTAISSVTRPSLHGSPRVGRTLIARPGAWRPRPTTLRYQWYVGSTRIRGRSGTRLVVRKAWVGRRLHVRVTASRPGYLPTTRPSPWTARVRR